MANDERIELLRAVAECAPKVFTEKQQRLFDASGRITFGIHAPAGRTECRRMMEMRRRMINNDIPRPE